MTGRNEARWLLDHKCETKDCWHWTEPNYTHCAHCSMEPCRYFTNEQREVMLLAEAAEQYLEEIDDILI